MRSLLENKRLVLLLAVLALGALTVLAVSLNGVPFREAQHYARRESADLQAPVAPLPPIQVDAPVWKQLVAFGLLILLVVLIGALISPRFRKRLFWLLLKAGIWIFAIYFLMTRYGYIFADLLSWLLGQNGGDVKRLVPDDPSLAPMPVFEPPPVSSTTSYVISFAFALALLVVLWAFYQSWKRYTALTTPQKPLADIARIARSSLDDLSSGRNSGDVIINCYLRMSDVVSNRRQLQREIAMTPHEFAMRLEQAGLPGEAVAQLTRLFEGVRYGDRKSAPRDIREAVNCLETILQSCGEPI